MARAADTKTMDVDELHGEALALALRATGLSVAEIAVQCGVTRQAVRDWLTGKIQRRPHQAQREKIAALLERTAPKVAA